jgi:hypothetical protein
VKRRGSRDHPSPLVDRIDSSYNEKMNRDVVIATLRANEAPLREKGVVSVALFGSAARGEASSGSDLDIMVEIDPAARIDVYDYAGITQFIADLFPVRVDVAERAMLIEPVRETADRDALLAF